MLDGKMFPQKFVKLIHGRLGLSKQCGAQRVEKMMPLWCAARLEVNSVKTRRVKTTFGGGNVEKMQDVVARNTFGTPIAERTPNGTLL